uniref:Uncharacterized protein n=1 Tax=Pristionchus pacificus TaxID=54126 RepID=A0A8R1YLV6_PRIPA
MDRREEDAPSSHTGFRFVAAFHFLMLFAMVVYVDGSMHINAVQMKVSDQCIHEHSRLLTKKLDDKIDQFSFYYIALVHFIAILGCFHNALLWLGICSYKIMFLLTMYMTLLQGMSGYIENCLYIITLFCVAHLGMAIGLFYLHILFIYTHRGTTFYQWIPFKIREIYLSFVDKNRHPRDHLIEKITGIEYTRRKHQKKSLLEEDQEEFEKLIEKTCRDEEIQDHPLDWTRLYASFSLFFALLISRFSRMAVWKSYVLYRIITGTTLSLLTAKIFLYYSIAAPIRLITVEWDTNFDEVSFYTLLSGHSIAITCPYLSYFSASMENWFACVYIDLLWLGLAMYKIMFILTIGFTLAQGMSGYMENCPNLFILFCADHMGMIICLFNLHILFAYTHRGITFYQWIPLKLREIYVSLANKNRNQKDHFIGNITGIEYTKRKRERISLLEEDYEEFENLIEKTLWKSYSLYRFVTATTLTCLFAEIFVYYTTEAPMLKSVSHNPFKRQSEGSHPCVYSDSRLWGAKFDSDINQNAFYLIGVAHSIAIASCLYTHLLWLAIVIYKIHLILTMFMTVGQGMSGYLQKCPHVFTLFCIMHFGMIICLFNLHILFIYTHRGATFYQWIPSKIGELYPSIQNKYLSLTDKNIHPKDHLIEKIPGIKYSKRKYDRISLLDEDQEEFDKLIEKTGEEG